MTVPLKGKGSSQQINHLEAAGSDWKRKHRELVRQSLAQSRHLDLALDLLDAVYRSLLVSHWQAEVDSSAQLMIGTFAALAADPTLSHGEALQKAMLAMIDDPTRPWAKPKFWAPFVVVGEPAKPRD